MKAPLLGNVAILGTGLIGGSLAAALKHNHIAVHIAAYDNSAQALQFLKQGDYADSVHDSATEAVMDADVVVLASPPETFAALAQTIAPHLKPGCIVTDVASVKRKAISSVLPYLPGHVHFVPGHPIAGSQKSGAEATDSQLFTGRRVILTPTEAQVLSEPVAQIRSLWETLGTQVEHMPAELHDRIYAYVSHLPQLAAFAAKPFVTLPTPASAGVLRLAQSSIPLWTEICFANADFIHESLEEFCIFLSQMSHELSEHAEEAISNTPEEAPALLCAVVALCLVATSLLMEQQTGIHAGQYGGNGFKDMVAAAGNQSDSVLAAISSHPGEVAALLDGTLNRLRAIGAALSSASKEKLHQALAA